jgi:hypothetical protein
MNSRENECKFVVSFMHETLSLIKGKAKHPPLSGNVIALSSMRSHFTNGATLAPYTRD